MCAEAGWEVKGTAGATLRSMLRLRRSLRAESAAAAADDGRALCAQATHGESPTGTESRVTSMA